MVITDDYKLYTGNIKLDTKLGDKVKFGLRATPSYTSQRRLPTSIHNPTRQSPWLPIYHTEETLQFIDRDVYPNVGVGDYFYENHLVNLDLDNDGNTERPVLPVIQIPMPNMWKESTMSIILNYLVLHM